MENDLTLLEICYIKKCQEVDKLRAKLEEYESILEFLKSKKVDYTKIDCAVV